MSRLRWIGFLLLLPFAAVASIAVVLVVAIAFYARALGQGLFSVLLAPFRRRSPSVTPGAAPHFLEKTRVPAPREP